MWANLLRFSGCLCWVKRRMRRSGAVVVLTFHRVLDDERLRSTASLPGIIVRQRTFERLTSYVERWYEAVHPGVVEPGEASERIRVALTFDDAWSDNYPVALPIAQAHNVPMTVFVCPALTGAASPFWPEQISAVLEAAGRRKEVEAIIEDLKHRTRENRERRIKGLVKELAASGVAKKCSTDSTLPWEEIETMGRAGVAFGSHTMTHQILTTVPEETVRRELRESKRIIEQRLGRACDLFAYPNGDWTPATRTMLSEAGYRFAFTTRHGVWTKQSDRLAIPRLNVCEENLVGLAGGFSPAMFEYTTIWKAWRAEKAASIFRTRVAAHRAAAA
jgi:peptidoglycan/xylan/chitin deacetylase (PgdA/CDA1 family)